EYRVHRDKPLHAVWVARGEDRADGPAPVLHDQGDVVKVELLDQPPHVLRGAAERVFAIGGRFRFAKAHVVGGDDAEISRKRRNEVAVQVGPGRLAVDQDDRLAGTFVDVVHPEAGRGRKVGRKGKRAVERLIRRNAAHSRVRVVTL